MAKKQPFPILSKRELLKRVGSKKLEDPKLISQIESFFTKNRGYSFSMPKPGEPVILMLSGGLDSTIIWDVLMRVYKLNVYPLFLRRGQIRMPTEERSINRFAKIYQKEFPKLFHKPKKINAFIPPLEFRFELTKFAEVKINKNTGQWLGLPMYGTLMTSYAVNYGIYLDKYHHVSPKTIFFGFIEKDGTVMKYETLTFTRLAMSHVCHSTGDFNWQVSALALEKNLGHYFDKDVLISYAKKHHLPVHDTYSCLEPHLFHCGDCHYCHTRHRQMMKNYSNDKTIYINRNRWSKHILFLISKLLFVIHYVNFFFEINTVFFKFISKYFFGRKINKKQTNLS